MTDPQYRITLEALDEDQNVVARFGSKGMNFTADEDQIGRYIYNTIWHYESGGYTTRGLDPQPSPLAEALEDAQERVYRVNVDNGWYEDDRTVGDDIALLHSEVSEMLEAYREGGLADQTAPAATPEGVGLPKPEGFGSEAADVLVRLLDTCKRRKVNLAFEFERKLAYNKTRGHKHGGKLI
jgi:NTP pyrophosphatase (non-canonical NTP hydrolase)